MFQPLLGHTGCSLNNSLSSPYRDIRGWPSIYRYYKEFCWPWNIALGGIGDTIRVSLTAEPEEEVRVAYEILKSLGLRKKGAEIISCPTCGRCGINLREIATEVEYRLREIDKPMKVAVMGCVVNGPGEAREADFGIAGGKGIGILFRKGKIIKRIKEEDLLNELMNEISLWK
jgi:(E)-4-hydroxy-3-methylbut-2-enyl-diphosphate synthase